MRKKKVMQWCDCCCKSGAGACIWRMASVTVNSLLDAFTQHKVLLYRESALTAIRCNTVLQLISNMSLTALPISFDLLNLMLLSACVL